MNPQIRIWINDGKKIDIELYPEVAPISVANFLKLIDEHYYDGVVFHRVIKDFMIQTGGYYLEEIKDEDGEIRNVIKDKTKTQCIKGEFKANGVKNSLKHQKGVISMARANDMNSASSQFFICSVDTPHLDGLYAAFGKVMDDESMKEVLKISLIPTTVVGRMFQDFPRSIISIKTIERIN